MKFIFSFMLLVQSWIFAQDNFVIQIDQGISPGALALCQDGFKMAAKEDAKVIIIELNTPGGLVTSTREIVRLIRESSIPVAVYVAPSGAQAASAGTFIVYASHLAAMAPVTNIGAATPVSLAGDMPGEKEAKKGDKESESELKSQAKKMEEKVMNDLLAFARSLATETQRNEAFIVDAVKTAKSISAREALKMGVVEILASSREDLIQKMQGRKVKVQGNTVQINTQVSSVSVYEPPLRLKILSLITDPSITYLLILAGIYGILLELYSPGSLFPGVLGVLSLILAGYALNLLPVNFAGVLLMIVGSVLLIAEALMPSFGVLGFGGVIAIILGGLFLFDTVLPGFAVGYGALSTSILLMLLMLILVRMVYKARNRTPQAGHEELVGRIAKVTRPINPNGEILIMGERWSASSDRNITVGSLVKIHRVEGLICHVTKQEEEDGS